MTRGDNGVLVKASDATRIVDAIMDDCRGRCGLGNEFDSMDDDIIDEIRTEWIRIVLED